MAIVVALRGIKDLNWAPVVTYGDFKGLPRRIWDTNRTAEWPMKSLACRCVLRDMQCIPVALCGDLVSMLMRKLVRLPLQVWEGELNDGVAHGKVIHPTLGA